MHVMVLGGLVKRLVTHREPVRKAILSAQDMFRVLSEYPKRIWVIYLDETRLLDIPNQKKVEWETSRLVAGIKK